MNLEDRMSQIEARLAAIEKSLKLSAPTPSMPPKPQPGDAPDAPQAGPSPLVIKPAMPKLPTYEATSFPVFPVTNILGWAGATALVMASIYLVVLAIDAGWLTPIRQLILAMLGGLSCIAVGLLLRDKDMHYASLLPAAGIVILFLSMYGAHNYYHLTDTTFATSGIIVICLLSLRLNRLFMSELYATFAVIGSYTAPLFLGGFGYSIADLIVYFVCWSVLFSIFSIWVGKRGIYILAMYLALVIFDLKWSGLFAEEWVEALVFQTVHFLIFVIAASVFSIRVAPMSEGSALTHAPALLLFYFVQYHILTKHVPHLAPWIAVASAAVLLVSYYIVQRWLAESLAGGRMLLSAYVALVLLHAGYIESVPTQWAPWVGLLVLPFIAAYGAFRGDIKAPGIPLWVAAGLIFIANYMRLFPGYLMLPDAQDVPAQDLLGLCYAAELYLAYYFSRKAGGLNGIGVLALYGGHIAIMAWALHMFDSRFIVSVAWGALALGCLFLSLNRRDKALGQSSLLVFAACVFKALLYDIAMAAPPIRIASLLVLGGSLYLGGWLYKKVSALEAEEA